MTQSVCEARTPRSRFDASLREPGQPAGPAGGEGEIVEVQFLLPRPILDELIDAADEEGITAARLLRRLVVHHLGGKGR